MADPRNGGPKSFFLLLLFGFLLWTTAVLNTSTAHTCAYTAVRYWSITKVAPLLLDKDEDFPGKARVYSSAGARSRQLRGGRGERAQMVVRRPGVDWPFGVPYQCKAGVPSLSFPLFPLSSSPLLSLFSPPLLSSPFRSRPLKSS